MTKRQLYKTCVALVIGFTLLWTPNCIKAEDAVAENITQDILTETQSASDKTSINKGFTWGGEVGSSVDLTGNDLTTFDAHIDFGYSFSYFQFLGVGFGVHRSLGSSNAFVPIDVVIRTNFRKHPSLLFMNLQTGYSFNTISKDSYKGGYQLSIGLGINLTQTPKLRSFITLSYGYFHINARQVDNLRMDINHVDLAQLGIGIQF
jgi:hypothetical protein